jgi:sec-independent protein translocase protein TatA|tara:strand:- start:35267 stop:35452 length:186 start_codon:yes stop_codon:yes gene_type:complete
MSLGVTELVLILIIVFVIFGAGKLPNVMKDVGKSIKNLKDGIKESDSKDVPIKKTNKNNTK